MSASPVRVTPRYFPCLFLGVRPEEAVRLGGFLM